MTHDLPALCRQIRRDILSMTHAAGSGHPGGSLSAVEILVSLYFGQMRLDPARPDDPNRDRFLLSKGHAAPLLYSVLARRGYFDPALLPTLRQLGSPLQGHPHMAKLPGLDCSSGSLGQGLSIANGLALAARRTGRTYRTYCLLGDGELQEGQVWEAAMTAAHFALDTVCAIVDDNGVQLDGPTCEVINVAPLADKFREGQGGLLHGGPARLARQGPQRPRAGRRPGRAGGRRYPMNWNQIPRIPQRDGYGQGLLDLCAARPDVVVLDADVAASTRTNWVRDRFPDHFYNLGISEQDLVGTAAGLALGGQIPYVSTYGVFLSGRAFDQIRTTVCYNNLKVRFGGAHAGISVGPDGATHQALEDLALARVLPHMTVIAPCDSAQTRKAVLAAVDWPGPVYFRFGREAVPVITDETTPFTIGKARLVQRGRDCAVLACGAMVYEALVAAQALAAQGISLTVVDLHTIKPLDEAAIQEAARSCGALVTAEEHQLAGGLFGAVSEVVVRTCPVPMEAVAVQDTFGESGPPEALLVRYGLNADAIAQAVRRCLARKG